MEIQERILTYLLVYGKENKYRLARALKIDVWEVTKALSALEEEGKIEMKGGRAIFVKRGKPITAKTGKRKKQPKAEEEQPKEEQAEETETKEETPTEGELEEGQQVETPIEEELEKVSEEPTKEEVQETFEAKIEEKEGRIEGTVKFFNPNKGFGFITGDDGKEYYVHKSALREGVTIEANDRVSFKPVEGDKGPKAEEVEWVSQS